MAKERFCLVMKKAFCILHIVSIVVLAACHKPDEPQNSVPNIPVQPVYEVGDHFKNDTLEGVVFYTYGAHHGLMVSLEETCLPWCEPGHIMCETGATNPYEGWNNTNILMANYDLYNFPTIGWSYKRNTWHYIHYEHRMINHRQWYVPSMMELRYLLLNQEAVNATLRSLGCATLEEKTYWSSSETGTRGAAAVRLQNGEIIMSDSLKTLEFYVRAIRNY